MGSIAFWLLACTSKPEPVEGPTVSTLLGDAPGVAFVGNWTSSSCGSRAYARNIRFESDRGYAGIDLISPCPPGSDCVWSGMVLFMGFWTIKDTKELVLKELGGGGPGSPHPSVFTADMEGNLIEGSCKYQRGLTVPAGYTEEQVTPKMPTVPTVPPSEVPASTPAEVPSSTP